MTHQFQGQPQPFTAVHAPQDLTKNEFVDPQAAAAAAAALKDGTTAHEYLDNLGFAALDGTDIQLSYSDSSPPQSPPPVGTRTRRRSRTSASLWRSSRRRL